MTEATSVILGALVGAAAGLAGGGFAALASLRASQLAARAPLGPLLHELSNAVVRLNSTSDPNERFAALREFQRVWNQFAIQQRILCPSGRIANLMELVGATTKDMSSHPLLLTALAGQAVDKVTQMVGAHSNYLLQSRVRREEERMIRRWLASQQARDLNLSISVREKLEGVVKPTRYSKGIRRLSVVIGVICAVAIPAGCLLFWGGAESLRVRDLRELPWWVVRPYSAGFAGFYQGTDLIGLAIISLFSFCLGWVSVRAARMAVRILRWVASGFEEDKGN